MEISLQDLAALVQGQFAPGADGALRIHGAASVSDAGPGQVTFLGNLKYLAQLRASQASVALVPDDFADSIRAVAVRVADPSAAFARLLERFAPPQIPSFQGVHPSAVVGADVFLGEGVSIHACAVIEAGARLGDRCCVGAHGYVGHEAVLGADCVLAPRVTVGARCILGERVMVHSGAVLGSDGFGFEFVEGRHRKIPQTGIVQVDDDVEIGANVTIDRARFGRTWIGEGCKIDNLVQIAHNVVLGKHCIVVAQTGISGSTRLGNYVTLAGQVGVVGHIEIGDQAVVAAQSGVSKSVATGEVIFGSPAVPMREAKERLAYLGRLPKLFARVRVLEKHFKCQDRDSVRDSVSS